MKRLKTREVLQELPKEKYSHAAVARAIGISRQRVSKVMKELNTEKVKKKRPRIDEEGDRELLVTIKEILKECPAYGLRKVVAIMKNRYQIPVGKTRIERIMKENGLMLPPTRSMKKMFRGIPIKLKVEADRSNALWGIDMTWMWCGEDGWGYFHGVIDHHDKELLGYTFSRSCKAIGGVLALAEAAGKRPVESLELRSDNGCHYGARIFQDEIRRLGINHTRTMVNTPKGNAVIERFFKSLKSECVWLHRFKNFEEAKREVDQWVTHYNNRRPHQSLGYKTPVEYYEDIVQNVA